MKIGRRAEQLSRALTVPPSGAVTEGQLITLPEPARRWLQRAAPPGTGRPGTVRLRIRGRMVPRPGAGAVDLVAEEVLSPRIGFVWDARARIGPIRARILDSYHEGAGSMTGRLLGFIPFLNAAGADVTRSARGRLAAESVFVPTSLVAGEGLRWEPLDDDRAVVHFTIDGEAFAPSVRIDGEGRLLEVTMQRWGDVGREGYGPIPYGFAASGEAVFAGITIPSRFRGGWWYGSERFDPEEASEFEIVEGSVPLT